MAKRTAGMGLKGTIPHRGIEAPDHFDIAEIGIDNWIIRHWNEDGTLHHMSPEMTERSVWSLVTSLQRAGHRYKKHATDQRVIEEGRERWRNMQPDKRSSDR